MKSYTITVNGKAYAVAVEEDAVFGITVAPVVPAITPAAPATLAAAPAPTATSAGAADSVSVSVPMPGRVVVAKATAGQAVRKGDVILVLGAMKMENGTIAPQDETIASINASTGDSVESGTVLATLNQLKR